MNTTDDQLQKVQSWYKRHFDAQLRHLNGNASPKDMVLVKVTLVHLEPNLTSSGSDFLHVDAVDTHTAFVRSLD